MLAPVGEQRSMASDRQTVLKIRAFIADPSGYQTTSTLIRDTL